jgi:hypothetical protein
MFLKKNLNLIASTVLLSLTLTGCDIEALKPYEGRFKNTQKNCKSDHGDIVDIEVYTKDNSIRINDQFIRLGVEEEVENRYGYESSYKASGYKVVDNKLIKVDINRGQVRYKNADSEKWDIDASEEVITALNENTIRLDNCRFERIR